MDSGRNRVWTGRQAKEIGLVDELGGIELALEHAADSAGIERYRVEIYPRPKNKIEMLLDMFNINAARMKAANDPTRYYQQIRETLRQCSGLQARMVGLRVE